MLRPLARYTLRALLCLGCPCFLLAQTSAPGDSASSNTGAAGSTARFCI